MDLEQTPEISESESESLSERLAQYAEYVDLTKIFPEED